MNMQPSCNEIFQNLCRILRERDRLFPARDNRNTIDMHKYMDLFIRCLEKRRENIAWRPDGNLIETAISMAENPVFLCGQMKSGTTLLLELLDGHSELNTLPGDSWLWAKLTEKAQGETFSPELFRKHWLKRFINPVGQEPFWIFGNKENEYISALNYIDYWLSNLPMNAIRPVLAIVLSFFCANPKRSLNSNIWLEKTPGNEFRADSLFSNFPQAKFVHIVRDPRENLASIKRLYESRGWDWKSRSIIRTLVKSYDIALHNIEKFGRKRYLVIKYDDLTLFPEKEMNKVIDFLNIGWEDSLLLPTVNASLATANTMYRDRIAKGVIRRSDSDKWRKELTIYEQGLIHQAKEKASKVGCFWEMRRIDHINRLLFGWTLGL